MALTKTLKIIISLGVISAVFAAGIPAILIPLNNYREIKITYLYNAGVMIETHGWRIYIDPIDLTESYAELPADIILTTHGHADHVEISTLNLLQKNSTVYVFPNNLSSYIIYYDAIGVDPEDTLNIGPFTITAFYMYTFPVNGYPASHPEEANYTSYIVDINGFTIFHAGDSKNIPEYNQLVSGFIEVALLPLGPGCQTMVNMDIVDVIDTLGAKYLIPIHYGEGVCEDFISTYGSYFTECQLIYLKNLEWTMF